MAPSPFYYHFRYKLGTTTVNQDFIDYDAGKTALLAWASIERYVYTFCPGLSASSQQLVGPVHRPAWSFPPHSESVLRFWLVRPPRLWPFPSGRPFHPVFYGPPLRRIVDDWPEGPVQQSDMHERWKWNPSQIAPHDAPIRCPAPCIWPDSYGDAYRIQPPL